jgi:hypothetical protein
MRRSRSIVIAALSVALVFSSAYVALAAPRMATHRGRPAYKVTKPHVAGSTVAVGVAFDATGVVLPTIAADDSSTVVAVEVRRLSGPRKGGVLLSVPAVLSAADTTGTAYSASVTLTSEGQFALSAVVSRGGQVIMRTTARPVRAVLPYRVTKPRVLSSRVATGTSFEATGVVTPAIAVDDTSASVSVVAYKVGRRAKLTQVGSFDAVLTGPIGEGTGYSASVSISDSGRYVLVAYVTRDGLVVGHSTQRPIRVTAAPAS